jgi:ribosomal protein L22
VADDEKQKDDAAEEKPKPKRKPAARKPAAAKKEGAKAEAKKAEEKAEGEKAEKPKRTRKPAAKKPAAAAAKADEPAEAVKEADAAKEAEADAAEAEGKPEPEDEKARPRRRGGAAAAGSSTRRRRSPERPSENGAASVRASAKYVRCAPRKARLVIDHIRGKDVDQARAILMHTPRAASRDVLKLLESAIANAENNHELVADELRVGKAYVDEGPTLKRYRPRALGRATRIRKRTSHLTIELTAKE